MRRVDLTKSALLVIDLQRYFFEPESASFLSGAAKILPYVRALIGAFRGCSRPVIFTRHVHRRDEKPGQMQRWWGAKLPWEDDPLSELVGAILPQKGETVIQKSRYSAFEKTRLAALLRKLRLNTVVLCGVMTNLCVETTARDAFLKDFQPVIASDACAGKSAAHHEASLLNLGYGFAHIEKTASMMAHLPKTM
jgi:bifunctional isochorismate lyase / aryl carrier protein